MPAVLWIMAAALTILILVIVFGYYVHWRHREKAMVRDSETVANLSAERQRLMADNDELQKSINNYKDELLQLEAERKEQEQLREELAQLENQCLAKDQENESLRKEVGDLEQQKHFSLQTMTDFEGRKKELEGAILNLKTEIKDLENEKEKIEREIEQLKSEAGNLPQNVEMLQQKMEEFKKNIQGLREQKADLEVAVSSLQSENNYLEGDVLQKKEEQERLSKILDGKKYEIEDIKNNHGRLAAEVDRLQEMAEESQILIDKAEGIRAHLPSLFEEVETLEKQRKEAQDALESTTNELSQNRDELHKIQYELNRMLKDKADCSIMLSTLQSEQNYLEGDVARLREEIKSNKNQLKPLTQEINDLKIQKLSLEKELADLGLKRKEKAEVQEQVNCLIARKTTLEEDVKKIEEKIKKLAVCPDGSDPEDELAQYKNLLEPPECLRREQFVQAHEEQDEYAFLDSFKSSLSQMEIHYHPRVVDAFHTSLKCQAINPLTILAGVSGTGKTLLPIVYANMIGMHHLVLSVQPRWDSPQDLFGFYNYLEKKYKATDLSRSMIRLDPYNYNDQQYEILDSVWAQDRMFMVLLDEMNLARTEYYFSDFLSKLELRSQIDNPEEQRKRHNAEIELDVGPGIHRFRLWVPDNILFVGTMNEDETTQSLSDKVLDRANVLRFGKPDENIRLNTDQREKIVGNEYLPFKRWQEWQRKFDENDLWYDDVYKWTRSINSALDKVGRPFGFRVMKAIPTYVANYPRVNEDERYKLAFADQVEQKIIPKVRGLEIDDSRTNECLDEIQRTLENIMDVDPDLLKAFEGARDESRHSGLFTWHGVKRSMGNQ